jgi:RimJ/RimL family protein N-acetyltransferase|tara:strand:- start:1366 stop:1941 length:576 start_codon:yes stop_codon:yes gene_type:complete
MDKRDFFIVGKTIALRAINRNDVTNTNWYGWFNNEETTKNLQKHYFPNSLEKQMQFYESLINDNSKLQLMIIDKENPELVLGIVSVQKIDFINSNADISLVIGEEEARDLKCAHEVMGLIIKHSFETLNLHKITLGYKETLKFWGIFLMKRFGFEQEGELKEQMYKDGKYHNIILLGLTREKSIKHKNLKS